MRRRDLKAIGLPALARDKVVKLALLGMTFAIMLVLMSAQLQKADAATAEHLGILRLGSDEFFNYDYSSEENSGENVDWAIDMLFYNDSSVNKVKNDLNTWLPSKGSSAYAYFATPFGWSWDSDKGRKESLCTVVGDNVHYRIYGPSGTDRFYNLRWGFYNIASTHIDHNECNAIDKWSGESEKAEGIVSSDARRAFGRRHVKEDAINFHNPEKHYNEGSHHWKATDTRPWFGSDRKYPGPSFRRHCLGLAVAAWSRGRTSGRSQPSDRRRSGGGYQYRPRADTVITAFHQGVVAARSETGTRKMVPRPFCRLPEWRR